MLLTSILTYTRLLGVWNHVHTLFVFQRAFDFIFIFIFLYFFLDRVRFSVLYVSMFFLLVYPLIIGLINGNSALTMVNDVAIYFLFLTKILIFKVIFSRDAGFFVFEKWMKRYVYYTFLMILVMLFLAYFLKYSGFRFYFQAPLDITFVSAYLAALGSYAGFVFLVIYAALSGKRMILVGVLVVLIISVFRGLKLSSIFKLRTLLFCFLAVFIMYFSNLNFDNVPGLSKVTNLYEEFNDGNSKSLEGFIIRADPSRYVEVISLWRELDSYSLLLGKGFGFRYQYDLSILNYTLNNNESHSNSHFTPIGIVSKFGLLGLLVWSIFFLFLLRKSWKHSKYSVYGFAGYLFLSSLLVQSLFAFTLFGNLFLPIVVGYIMSTRSKYCDERN